MNNIVLSSILGALIAIYGTWFFTMEYSSFKALHNESTSECHMELFCTFLSKFFTIAVGTALIVLSV